MDLAKLLKLIDKHFNEEDLKTLCFYLDRVDYEALPAAGKSGKARELVTHCERNGKLSQLVAKCVELRPNLGWSKFQEPSEANTPNFPIFGISTRRNPNFTGREELLTRIYTNLNKDSAAVQIQALVGLGGVGKSKTAIEYAYRHAAEYDLIWWIRTETEDGLVDDYIQLANELNLPVKMNAENIAFINIVKQWLTTSNKKWLLIFDNAERHEQVGDVLPVKGNGHVLITSQDRGSWGYIANVLDVGSFTSEEARVFLIKRTGIDDYAHVDKVTELLGYFPLALEQAGSFMRQRGLPFEAYIKLYQEQRVDLWQREQAPTDYHTTLVTTWELAFQQIKVTSAAAAALLNLCSFLSPDDIPLSILEDGVNHLPEELREAVNSPFGLSDIIQTLSHYSLIERKENSLSIHRLVQDVSREQLGAERRKQWAEITLNLIAHIFVFDEYQLDTWAKSDRLLPQTSIVITRAEKYRVALESIADLSQNVGEYLRKQRGAYDEAQKAIERALAIRQEILGGDHAATAQSLNYLGELYYEQANYSQAQGYCEQALQIQKGQLGRANKDTVRSLNNLGLLLRTQSKYEEARPYFEEALSISKQVLGEIHPNTAISLSNLGTLLQDQVKYEEARPYFEEALSICEQVLGELHPDTATSLVKLGALLQDQGKYEEARPYFEEALSIYKQVLGGMHPNTATCLNILGSLRQAQGKYQEARPNFEEALFIHKQVLGGMHPNTATGLNWLGIFLRTQGKYEEARPYFEEALFIYEQVLSKTHPNTAACLNNLGLLLQDQGRSEEARPYFEEALSIYKQALGDMHPKTAPILNNLGSSLFMQGKYIQAKPYLEKASKLIEQVHGENHPSLVTILSNLGGIMVFLGQFFQARRYLQNARNICRDTEEQYAECEEVEQMLQRLPGKIGKSRGKAAKKKKRRR